MKYTYAINDAAPSTNSFIAAVNVAMAIRGEVFEVSTLTGERVQRWSPAPVSNKRRVRHVLVREDGTEIEFGKVRR